MQTVTQMRTLSLTSESSHRISRLNLTRNKSLMSALPPVPPSTMYSHNNRSEDSVFSNNYHLVRMDTRSSLNLAMLIPTQYRVLLNLSKHEIEMLRFTWNKMLLDDPIEQKLAIPGAFPMAEKSQTRVASRSSSTTMASSLFCRQFYANLLSMDPSLEKLFPSIKHQAVSFAGVMSLAITQLESLSNLDDYLIKLGKRHSRVLGIEPPNFELMGEALIQTFHQRFGVRFTQELEILWIKLYLYLANSILQFGIDPVMRFDRERESAAYNQGIPYNNSSYPAAEKRASVLTSLASTTSASILDLASIHTATTSIAQVLKKSLKDGVSLKIASIKKKKKDCVIM